MKIVAIKGHIENYDLKVIVKKLNGKYYSGYFDNNLCKMIFEKLPIAGCLDTYVMVKEFRLV